MTDPAPQPTVALGQTVETAPQPAAVPTEAVPTTAVPTEAGSANPPEGYEHVYDTSAGVGKGPQVMNVNPDLLVLCGPLLNYRGMGKDEQGRSTWRGTVLIVTAPGQKQPTLGLRSSGPTTAAQGKVQADGVIDDGKVKEVMGQQLYADPDKAFWRFSFEVPMEIYESKWAYAIPQLKYTNGRKQEEHNIWTFIVPSLSQSMRIMFHSCNGFSVGTDMETWKGPSLWHDVLRHHEEKPFHVMIGGGDQIYNDSVRVDDGPLRPWTDIKNPKKRQAHLFTNDMRNQCDRFYFNNYIRWYSTEPFATANARIPQINIWDDHDIIDGFGSYTDHFMRCSVFRGIGGVAFKYYCLFQHHCAPPMSTFTTDAPNTMQAVNNTAGPDPRQLENSFVYTETQDDPGLILGYKHGPYVEERGRNLLYRLGKKIAFVGLDCRTERTRHQVNYPETYDLVFGGLERELSAANGEIKHVILLLGVPIAYPRLAWLENIFSSPIIAPLRLLSRRFGFGGSFFNKFDGKVDLLDDLDDHYTAKHHKKERRVLIHRLQSISERFSVRITILGGDVHLAAVGRFYSKVSKKIPSIHDPKYMVNVISSAITNKPPPKAVSNLLARRNKIHHLDSHTDETLMNIFDIMPGNRAKADFNKVTMASRNYACITEVVHNGTVAAPLAEADLAGFPPPRNGHSPLHQGEVDAGSKHPVADGNTNTVGMEGSLDVSFQVEISSADVAGTTQGYGFWIPPLITQPTQAPRSHHPHNHGLPEQAATAQI